VLGSQLGERRPVDAAEHAVVPHAHELRVAASRRIVRIRIRPQFAQAPKLAHRLLRRRLDDRDRANALADMVDVRHEHRQAEPDEADRSERREAGHERMARIIANLAQHEDRERERRDEHAERQLNDPEKNERMTRGEN